MKALTFALLFLTILSACSNDKEQKQQVSKIKEVISPIVGRKNITNEIAGSAYRKRATAYFVISENDTSRFTPIFYESKVNGQVNIDLHQAYSHPTKTYLKQLNELKLILPEASKDYNFDSLTNLYLGRLISTGDLAVSITEAYRQKFGEQENTSTSDYAEISDFLLKSRLGKDLNEIFKPYNTTVESVDVEKVFFSEKKYLTNYNTLSRDTASIPNRILDCSTWVKFRRQN